MNETQLIFGFFASYLVVLICFIVGIGLIFLFNKPVVILGKNIKKNLLK